MGSIVIYCLQLWILTGVDSAVFADGGQDAGKWKAGFLLHIVADEQFQLL